MTISEIDGLADFLAGMYGILRRHEQSLVHLTIQTEAATAALKELNPRFAELFDNYESMGLRAVRDQHAEALRLFDGMIQQLRSA